MLATGTDEAVQSSMFTLVDRETGRMLALAARTSRPQIARGGGHPAARRAKPIRLGLRDERVPLRRAPRVALPRVLPGGRRAGRARPARGRGGDHRDGHRRACARSASSGSSSTSATPTSVRGLLDEVEGRPGHAARAARARWPARTAATLERLVAELAPPAHVRAALLALPTLFGREAVLERAAGFARNERVGRGRWRTWPRCIAS